jgi:hypothetical protein
MNVKILKNVTANIDGMSVVLKIGDVLELNKSDADNLINGGYAEGTKAAAKVKVQPPANGLNTRSFKKG